MSNARKLLTEIDRCMKKVDEGVELFDEIWEKVYSAEQQNQKEKYEMDLKKEIKKLQRQRDQIKTWISSSEVKDKDPLIEARKLIESKMEQFKICEKETKTKTYSKEGLAREDKLDPEEESKLNTTSWLGEYIEKFQQDLEEKEFEVERLSAGKGKKSNKTQLDELLQHVANHKFHINKLEGIIRLVNNDHLSVDIVDPLKDDLDYYLESYRDEDYAAAYDEEYFYESLGLDDLDLVNVDHVTVASSIAGKSKSDETTSLSSRGSKEKNPKKKSTISNVIPLTIGRARSKQEKEKAIKEEGGKDSIADETGLPKAATPSKRPTTTVPTSSTAEPKMAPLPTNTPAQSQQTPGTSMAAVLKRESEQQEKERQQRLAREQLAKAQAAEQLRQQQQAALVQRQQQETLRLQQQQEAARLQQQEAFRQQQQQQQLQQPSPAPQIDDAVKQQPEATQQQLSVSQSQKVAQAGVSQQAGLQAIQSSGHRVESHGHKEAMASIPPLKAAAGSAPSSSQSSIATPALPPTGSNNPTSAIDILTSGLGGLGLGNSAQGSAAPLSASGGSTGVPGTAAGDSADGLRAGNSATASALPSSSYGVALGDSFAAVPNTVDHERSSSGGGSYVPQNPYPTPVSYPTTPSPIFDKPDVFEKLGTDALFFIFYYAQGSYQQYLAARELKKQSWRFHKKYMTWFQRHEEPQITTDEYEQGTYVYFDYEAGWCTRIKTDFRFEYSYLEDSLQ